MIFLIDYDRRKGQLIEMVAFEDSEWQRAEDARLELELRLNRVHLDREVVLLQAQNEDVLRQSHGRYFWDLQHLLESLRHAGAH